MEDIRTSFHFVPSEGMIGRSRASHIRSFRSFGEKLTRGKIISILGRMLGIFQSAALLSVQRRQFLDNSFLPQKIFQIFRQDDLPDVDEILDVYYQFWDGRSA